jgi:hypothetical protein
VILELNLHKEKKESKKLITNEENSPAIRSYALLRHVDDSCGSRWD